MPLFLRFVWIAWLIFVGACTIPWFRSGVIRLGTPQIPMVITRKSQPLRYWGFVIFSFAILAVLASAAFLSR